MKNFTITGKVWRYEGPASWHFVYVNEALSRRIKDAARNRKKVGFHFVRVKATIGKTRWNTTLFPTKGGPYLLAIKADVRHKEGIAEGDLVKVQCSLL
ncbi:hypothetical protein A3A38_01335 [Candidatus Kaiserbacteria bacterium RIFCSPLOWO2_01_FULL_53_17]|uniref:DUF1905 domain-containing protein n=1 Tax=Candidatus Kaiserbacteria bacterium RIFCSPLOWO2_01_FULL_53_17 TaxID=1798511 RepID=A0A1F6EI38_9BACT|nr:MAG: hypothetical protein A3A38_01335 [Candidatus Kaiserbacteria bacterium RIFCSPLOWO2_01_FULL_53_17]